MRSYDSATLWKTPATRCVFSASDRPSSKPKWVVLWVEVGWSEGAGWRIGMVEENGLEYRRGDRSARTEARMTGLELMTTDCALEGRREARGDLPRIDKLVPPARRSKFWYRTRSTQPQRDQRCQDGTAESSHPAKTEPGTCGSPSGTTGENGYPLSWDPSHTNPAPLSPKRRLLNGHRKGILDVRDPATRTSKHAYTDDAVSASCVRRRTLAVNMALPKTITICLPFQIATPIRRKREARIIAMAPAGLRSGMVSSTAGIARVSV